MKNIDMTLNVHTQVIDLGDGREITIETGKLAKQADGSVVVRMGDTMLLATACAKESAGDEVDFMPLTVDYREMYAAAGRFPGGFFKREARPSDHEVLVSRLIDRALRPTFPDDFHADTQVLVYLISHDPEILPDSLAGLAASAALAVSDIPFTSPISEVRVSQIDGKFVVNPTRSENERSTLDLIVAGNYDDVVMVEGEMKEVSEATMIAAIRVAHEAIKLQVQAQLELSAKLGIEKRSYLHEHHDELLRERIQLFAYDRFYAIAAEGNPSKHRRQEQFRSVREDFISGITEEEAKTKSFLIKTYFHDVEKKAVRDSVLDHRVRLDGRKLDEIRPIWTEVDYLPSTHGSAVFTRGETQSLTTVTLGTKLDEQIIDGAVFEGKNRFLLHYNFPPFSTGEVKFMRGTGRREVGHGNLAMRALKQVVPSDFDYSVRIVSDILESNGSSSMATVCAGSMALMDAGVPIKEHVSGIAMGLIADGDRYAILSDILGDEDHLGDMDFKVTGTSVGITACQMDMKVKGLSFDVLAQALDQAREGRLHILGKLNEGISNSRSEFKPFVPRIVTVEVSNEFIGAIIGPGGKHIQELQRETNTTISIEEVGNIGIVEIAGSNPETLMIAVERIRLVSSHPEINKVYRGTVKKITAFGAFVEILPKKEGLLHVSEYAWTKTPDISEVLKEGDSIEVKLLEIDGTTGKLRLSHRALSPMPEGYVEPERSPRPPRRDGDRRDGDRRSARPFRRD
jgi:polyribonucleotide nucleotidyltransferase